MIMNALNGVWSKTYLLQIMIKIRKVDKTFVRELEFEDIKFPKIIRDIHKIEKEKNYIAIGVFGYENKKKNIQSMCQKLKRHIFSFKRHFDLLLIEEERKRYYVLIKDFSTFIYDYTQQR